MKPVHTSNILVCGTARNVAPKLKPFLSALDKSLSGFGTEITLFARVSLPMTPRAYCQILHPWEMTLTFS
jgi:Na+-translocating ferredoxin:NAD+ oxidoreductase RnfE subunit